jgi:hypothetical protein
MAPLLRLGLLLAAGCGTATATPPAFSWSTVPVFAETSNVSGVFDERALAVLKRFPVFVGEKAYDYHAAGFAEDKLAALAQQLRRLNPAIFLVFYYNANLDMDDYRLNALSEAAAPSWWLRNSSGVPMVAPGDSGAGSRPPFPYAANDLGGLHCWDHTNPAVREAWSQECLNMTSAAGGFDGCMVDRWTRNPFKGQPGEPASPGKIHPAQLCVRRATQCRETPGVGYTAAAVREWQAGMNQSESLLLETTRAAKTWLIGEGERRTRKPQAFPFSEIIQRVMYTKF